VPSVVVEKDPIQRITLPSGDARPLSVMACIDRLQVGFPVPIETIEAALVFLSYKPFAPFWPVAEAQWGPGLERLREDLAQEARRKSATTAGLDGLVRSRTAAELNVARALLPLGYFAEAKDRLDARIDDVIANRASGTRDLDFDLVMLAAVRASVVDAELGPGAAARFLDEFASRVPIEPDLLVNLAINRAAYLVESERYEEALALLNPAYEQFQAGVAEQENYQIAGSQREFAWILACAHARLGAEQASQSYARLVTSAEETPTDSYLQRTKPSTYIKLRMYRCMNDSSGYFGTWRDANEPILSRAWLDFQLAKRRAFVGVERDWATLPEAAALSGEYRQLPDEYIPALTRWQSPTVAGD
jgi:hypothetical protein